MVCKCCWFESLKKNVKKEKKKKKEQEAVRE